jgi:hypothetical protein
MRAFWKSNQMRQGGLSGRPGIGHGVLVCALVLASTVSAAKWETGVTSGSPPTFPAPRPMRAKYGFGWSGFPGATAEVRLSKPSADRIQFDGIVHTTGLVRTLWKFDANYASIVDAGTLHPLDVRHTENLRSKKTVTTLAFGPDGVNSKETETPSKNPGPKVRRFDSPNLFDLLSALLYLRSQPLQDRSVQRVVVYPQTSAYLATVTAQGRERLTVPAGTYNAIKLDLQLSKIGKNRELEPHRKFRRATVWMSDDPDRLLLKVEAQVFVGAVFVELQSVDFDRTVPHLD